MFRPAAERAAAGAAWRTDRPPRRLGGGRPPRRGARRGCRGRGRGFVPFLPN